MIKIKNVEIVGWEAAIRGMRNPMNSWDRSDSDSFRSFEYCVGPKDFELMMKLAKGGSVHAKYRRMIQVYLDITAPLYWWKEFETYRIGVIPNPTDIEMNSCSTMHKIHEKEFTMDDFSHEHMNEDSLIVMDDLIDCLNVYRRLFIETCDKEDWWQMIQLLPSSYNQRRTLNLNYETLSNIYIHRKDHKLDEWRELCNWIETLPYSQVITLKED